MHFVEYHMFELLIEHWAREYVGIKRSPIDTAVKDVFSSIVQPVAYQSEFSTLNGVSRSKLFPKCRSIRLPSLKHSGLSYKKFNELSHRHSRRKPVRIHDEIRRKALFVKRHVYLRNNETADSLLPVTRSKLVPKLWSPHLSQHDFDSESRKQ
jgi:hypothetical protein